MKKLVLTLVALLVMAVQASAMSYEQARQQALFLTDKMAYELNLTDAQYEAAYEINLDYLMSINTYDDLYGVYWRQRNLDLSYVLLDWQYRTYVGAAYFYRPLYWDGGYWHFSIYARYPHRDYFFFGRPSIYVTYYGGHSWRMNGGRSWYYGRLAGAHASTAETLVIVVTETVALAMAHVSAATTAIAASVAEAVPTVCRVRPRAMTHNATAPARLEPVRAVHVLP